MEKPEAQGPSLEAAGSRIEGLLFPKEKAQNTNETPAEEAPAEQDDSKEAETADDETPTTETPAAETAQPEDEEESEEDHPKPRGFKVKVAGQEVEVTEDELKSGYSRTADYTRKTTQLAEERKAFEAEAAKVSAERREYLARLKEVDDALKALTPEEPDWVALQKTLPSDQFTARLLEHQQTEKAREAIKAEAKAVQDAADADHRAAFRKHLDTQAARLQDLIPSWKDEKVAKSEQLAIRAFAKTQGFEDSDLDGINDARAVIVLHKAYLYDKGQKAKPKVEEKIAASIATSTPGSNTPRKTASKIATAKAKLAKSGSLEDGAAAIEHLL